MDGLTGCVLSQSWVFHSWSLSSTNSNSRSLHKSLGSYVLGVLADEDDNDDDMDEGSSSLLLSGSGNNGGGGGLARSGTVAEGTMLPPPPVARAASALSLPSGTQPPGVVRGSSKRCVLDVFYVCCLCCILHVFRFLNRKNSPPPKHETTTNDRGPKWPEYRGVDGRRLRFHSFCRCSTGHLKHSERDALRCVFVVFVCMYGVGGRDWQWRFDFKSMF